MVFIIMSLLTIMMINSLILMYESIAYWNLNSINPLQGIDFWTHYMSRISHPIIFTIITIIDIKIIHYFIQKMKIKFALK